MSHSEGEAENQEDTRTPIPQGYATLYTYISKINFLWHQMTSKSRAGSELVYARASSYQFRSAKDFPNKLIVAIVSNAVKWPRCGNSRAHLQLLAKHREMGFYRLARALLSLSCICRIWGFRSPGDKTTQL